MSDEYVCMYQQNNSYTAAMLGVNELNSTQIFNFWFLSVNFYIHLKNNDT